MIGWLAMRLHALAGRLDPQLDFRCATSLTLTLEPGRGWVLREDGRGIPVWYRNAEYGRAWDEAGGVTPHHRGDERALICVPDLGEDPHDHQAHGHIPGRRLDGRDDDIDGAGYRPPPT